MYIFDNRFVAGLGTSETNLTLAVTNAEVVNGSVSCDISLYKIMH